MNENEYDYDNYTIPYTTLLPPAPIHHSHLRQYRTGLVPRLISP